MLLQVEFYAQWLDGLSDPMHAGYQVKQSLIGLGRGGWLGQGLAHSKQKFFFLPDSHTDFIFSILCEEFGFVLLLSSSDSGADQTLSDASGVLDSEFGLKRSTHGVGALNDFGESFIGAMIEFIAEASGFAIGRLEGASQ